MKCCDNIEDRKSFSFVLKGQRRLSSGLDSLQYVFFLWALMMQSDITEPNPINCLSVHVTQCLDLRDHKVDVTAKIVYSLTNLYTGSALMSNFTFRNWAAALFGFLELHNDLQLTVVSELSVKRLCMRPKSRQAQSESSWQTRWSI